MGDFFIFWWTCIQRSWGFANGAMSSVGSISLLVTLMLLFPTSLREKLPPNWKERLQKGSLYLFLATFLLFIFVVPYLQYHEKDAEAKRAISERDEARRALQAQSPSAVKEELEALRAEVQRSKAEAAADEWPPLSAMQIEEWAAKLAPYHLIQIYVFWSNEVNAGRLYKSLQALGKKMRVPVNFGLGSADGPGVQLLVDQTNPVGPVLLDLFNASHYPAKLQDFTKQGSTIDIFIGERSEQ